MTKEPDRLYGISLEPLYTQGKHSARSISVGLAGPTYMFDDFFHQGEVFYSESICVSICPASFSLYVAKSKI